MPTETYGTLDRVLYINLDKLTSQVKRRPDLIQAGLGGSGVAIRLLEEECPPGCDPLSPENPIILAVGPLVGHFPMASKTTAMFKSPHTGNLGESHAGGRSAVSIRSAGYGAIVIKGKSQHPVYLVIDSKGVKVRDASALWGMRSSYTVGSVLRKREKGSGNRSILRIGRAGEQMVTYSCVITETYRHFGRLGLGALFGSKNLKALVIEGKDSLEVAQKKTYRGIYDQIYKSAVDSPLMKKYHNLGTAMNVIPLDAIGGLPTRNLQSGRFEMAEAISGEKLAEDYLGRRVACAHCPVACVHLAALRLPYPDDPYFYKTLMLAYDHEPIFAMGSLLGIGEVPGLLQLMDEAEILGLDVMSAGVALAWATEALQKKLVSPEDTLGLELAFGDWQIYIKALKNIVSGKNEFYKALARGVDYASAQFGGADFALAFGGNEMPGYHTGPAGHLGYLSGARHSHLDNAGYSVDQAILKSGEDVSPEELAEKLTTEEAWRQVLSSLVVCFFARGVYTPEVILQALESIGIRYTEEQLYELGRDVLKRKQAFKIREGFELKEVRIPRRILETVSPRGQIDEAYMRQTLEVLARDYGK